MKNLFPLREIPQIFSNFAVKMKQILPIFLLVLLAGVLAGGCRRAPGAAEARLIALDSLIGEAPDSALTLLQAVDTAALSEADRAYLDLLTTQALSKARIPATDSTAICRAWRFYAGHGPCDRRIRAMRYRATVAKEMGDPVEAMHWYKRTELAATDHDTKGFALMSMGILYQKAQHVDKASRLYLEAISHTGDGNPSRSVFCQQQLSQMLLMLNKTDSALMFSAEVNDYATRTRDTSLMCLSKATQAAAQLYSGRYQEAILIHSDLWLTKMGMFSREKCLVC